MAKTRTTVDDFDLTPFSNPSLLQSACEKLKMLDIKRVRRIPFLLSLTKRADGITMDDILQRFKDAEIFPDDVIAVGFPRSGNRWVYYTTGMVMSQDLKFNETDFVFRIPETSEDVNTLLDSLPKPRHFTSHLPLDMLPNQILKQKPKIVYILRNPKDAFVSFCRIMHTMKDPANFFTGSWAEFFELMLTGEMWYGSWFDHVLRSEKFMKDHPEVSIFVLQYEKYKENPSKVVAELCRFLGQPESKAQDIARETEMESMRTSLQTQLGQIEEVFLKENCFLHKKGIIGDWKNHFTVEQSERFNRLFDAKMKGSELAKRVRPYI